MAVMSFIEGALDALSITYVPKSVLQACVPPLLILIAAYFAFSPKPNEQARKALFTQRGDHLATGAGNGVRGFCGGSTGRTLRSALWPPADQAITGLCLLHHGNQVAARPRQPDWRVVTSTRSLTVHHSISNRLLRNGPTLRRSRTSSSMRGSSGRYSFTCR